MAHGMILPLETASGIWCSPSSTFTTNPVPVLTGIGLSPFLYNRRYIHTCLRPVFDDLTIGDGDEARITFFDLCHMLRLDHDT